MAVAVVVWGLILWAVIFHRKRGDRLPPQVRYNLPIEILYTALPFVLIAVLFYYTAKDENYIDKLSSNPNVTVNVIGYQWSWQFQYPQYNVTDNGVMYPGPLPMLELPTGRDVRFNLTSPDVIHSFWVPEFLFKRDVIPGHPNHFEVTLTKTGTYIGHCSELCGLYHSRMLFTLKVVTPDQFQAVDLVAAGGLEFVIRRAARGEDGIQEWCSVSTIEQQPARRHRHADHPGAAHRA